MSLLYPGARDPRLPSAESLLAWARRGRRRDRHRLGADAGDGEPLRPRPGRAAAGVARRPRGCSRSPSGSRLIWLSRSLAGAGGAPGSSRSPSSSPRPSRTSRRASTSRRRRSRCSCSRRSLRGGAASTCPATLRASGRCSASARPSRASPRSAVGVELRGVELPDRAGDALLGRRPSSSAFSRSTSGCGRFGTPSRRRWASGGSRAALVDGYGSDSLSFFALRRDKSYLFSPSRRAFLAYRVVAGTALVSGDPVGDEAEFDALLAEFRRVARARGWRLAVVGASDEHLDALPRGSGMRAIPIGDEAVLGPREFSLEGRAIRKVRQSVSRLDKAGYSFRVVAADEVDARAARSSSRTSRRRGAAASRSAASRWRSTTSTRPAPCSPSPKTRTGGSAASSTSRRRRPAAAGR